MSRGPDLAKPHHGLQQLRDLLDHVALLLPLDLLLAVGSAHRRILAGAGEDAPELVHHDHVVGLEPLDAVGHDVDDPLGVLVGERAGAPQAQQHGGLGVLLLRHEGTVVGGRDVDPCLSHQLGQALLQGLGEVGFHRPAVDHLLTEVRGREARGLQLLEAQLVPRQQSLACHGQAELAHLLLGHQDRPLVGAQVVGDVLLLQLLHDRVGIARRQVGGQGGHRLLGGPDPQSRQRQDGDRQDGSHHRLLRGGHVLEGFLELGGEIVLAGHGILSMAGERGATSASASRCGRRRSTCPGRPSSSGN